MFLSLQVTIRCLTPLSGGLLAGSMLHESDFDREDRKGSRWDTGPGGFALAKQQRIENAPFMPIVRELKAYLVREHLKLYVSMSY